MENTLLCECGGCRVCRWRLADPKRQAAADEARRVGGYDRRPARGGAGRARPPSRTPLPVRGACRHLDPDPVQLCPAGDAMLHTHECLAGHGDKGLCTRRWVCQGCRFWEPA